MSPSRRPAQHASFCSSGERGKGWGGGIGAAEFRGEGGTRASVCASACACVGMGWENWGGAEVGVTLGQGAAAVRRQRRDQEVEWKERGGGMAKSDYSRLEQYEQFRSSVFGSIRKEDLKFGDIFENPLREVFGSIRFPAGHSRISKSIFLSVADQRLPKEARLRLYQKKVTYFPFQQSTQQISSSTTIQGHGSQKTSNISQLLSSTDIPIGSNVTDHHITSSNRRSLSSVLCLISTQDERAGGWLAK
jgi:hypothetical protein